jgi:hypothetical protein
MKFSKVRVAATRRLSRLQCGQSSLEYVVVCFAIAFSLGVGMSTDESILKVLLEAFRTGYQRISFALSLPI